MDFRLTDEQRAIRQAVRELCRAFPDRYWRDLDRTGGYPDAFVAALTEAGGAGALDPGTDRGGGAGGEAGRLSLEEINRSGGFAAACHAQMYTMGTLLRHGSAAQKARYLPAIARGELRLQAFAVTEPNAGSETTRIETTAVRQGDRYVVHG